MDILVATPVWSKWNDLTLRSMGEMRNPTGGRFDFVQLRDGYIELDDGGRENLVSKQEQARHLAISGGYDYLLFVEEDMLVPPDAVEKLLACQSSVAYSLYVFRRPPYLWSAFTVIDEDRVVGHPITSNPALAKNSFLNGEILDTDGVGFGCTLVHRSVLEKIPFRIDYQKPHGSGEFSHSDFYFAIDCIEAGINAKIHMGCVCGHISPLNEICRPKPTVLFPVVDGEDGAWYTFAKIPE